MNLAQLIDPERAERMKSERGPSAAERRRHLPETPFDDEPAKLERRPPKLLQAVGGPCDAAPAENFRRTLGISGAVLQLCAEAQAGLLGLGMAREMGVSINSVCSILSKLLKDGYLRRTGKRRDYLYTITASGRKRLAQIRSAAGIS